MTTTAASATVTAPDTNNRAPIIRTASPPIPNSRSCHIDFAEGTPSSNVASTVDRDSSQAPQTVITVYATAPATSTIPLSRPTTSSQRSPTKRALMPTIMGRSIRKI